MLTFFAKEKPAHNIHMWLMIVHKRFQWIYGAVKNRKKSTIPYRVTIISLVF